MSEKLDHIVGICDTSGEVADVCIRINAYDEGKNTSDWRATLLLSTVDKQSILQP